MGSGVAVGQQRERALHLCDPKSMQGAWDAWLWEAVTGLQSAHLLRSLRPVTAQCASPPTTADVAPASPPPPTPASSVHVRLAPATLAAWLADEPSTGGPADGHLSVSYAPQVCEPHSLTVACACVPSLATPCCSTAPPGSRVTASPSQYRCCQSIGRVMRQPVYLKARNPNVASIAVCCMSSEARPASCNKLNITSSWAGNRQLMPGQGESSKPTAGGKRGQAESRSPLDAAVVRTTGGGQRAAEGTYGRGPCGAVVLYQRLPGLVRAPGGGGGGGHGGGALRHGTACIRAGGGLHQPRAPRLSPSSTCVCESERESVCVCLSWLLAT